MIATIFPGQGAQYVGMGKQLCEQDAAAAAMFKTADEIVGFSVSDIMFNGTEEALKATDVTQPAVFLHSVTAFQVLKGDIVPSMVAGHSLGEYSALVACRALSFEDAMSLVLKRARAMQKACESAPSGMAVVTGMDDDTVKTVCQTIDEVVVPANYNCPGQLVISGTMKGLALAEPALKKAGARRVLLLKVGGAFHSPLMKSAQEELAEAIDKTSFHAPVCPIYQNCTALPSDDPVTIKKNLIAQLTAPVLWTKTIRQMIADGASQFIEFGPGEVLQGLIKKIDSSVPICGKN